MSLFNELKRRNVLRVGIAYVVAAWLLLQVIDFALDIIGAPNWIMQVLVLLGAVGLPAVLIFAWVFEMTPEGLKRESEIQSDESVTAHTARKLDKMTMAMLIAVVVLVIADRFVPDNGETNQPVAKEVSVPAIEPVAEEKPAPSMPSLAVLPFTNMSADPDNEYFSDGISEELLNLLVQVDGLRVPSRTSSFAFKGMNMDIKEIARKLAVEHVLEGSVRKAGSQVRITAQLIDVSTDTHLWSNTYDRELENIFAIQDEISREIVNELKITLETSGLVSRDESRPTDDMQAYQDYLRGRHLFIQRGVPGLRASIAALQSAVARDPAFAEAWAALSQSAATISGWDAANAEESNQIALEAGNRALELDNKSATAFAGLGLLSYNLGNWPRSLELMEKAANLSKDSTPTYFYGMILRSCGYITEAHEMFLQAELLDPVYPQLQFFLGLSAMSRNDLALARVHFKRTIDGGNFNGVFGMYWLALNSGDFDEAITYMDDIRVNTEAGLGGGYQKSHVDAVSAALKDSTLADNVINEAGDSGDLVILSHFGATTEVVQVLNQRWADGETLPLAISLSRELWTPEFSDLRQMPEYKQFLADIGMVDLWRTRGWPDLCHTVGENDFECE